MIGYYNYTVILTYIGTIVGFTGITYTLLGQLKLPLICLIIAGFCDMFDGKIASTKKRSKQEKRCGIQIDSLSDLICFGVFPALIVFQQSEKTFLHIIIFGAYVLCALIRLAWYNVDEEERQDSEMAERKNYLGMPVTSAALLVPFFMGGVSFLNLPLGNFCPWFLIPISLAFVAPFSLKKPGSVGKIVMMLCGILTLVFVIYGVKI